MIAVVQQSAWALKDEQKTNQTVLKKNYHTYVHARFQTDMTYHGSNHQRFHLGLINMKSFVKIERLNGCSRSTQKQTIKLSSWSERKTIKWGAGTWNEIRMGIEWYNTMANSCQIEWAIGTWVNVWYTHTSNISTSWTTKAPY